MKLRQLESELSRVRPFERPKIQLEQYPTTAHLAAHMLYYATEQGDIEDCWVADLGAGCGMLSIASSWMDAQHVVGIDIDPDALAQAKANMEPWMPIDLVRQNVAQLASLRPGAPVDTVVMNPPFGTRQAHADAEFLLSAARMAPHAIYSLHKSSTRDFIGTKLVRQMAGYHGEVVAQLVYNLDKSYSFHRKREVDIAVDLWRFEQE